MNAWSRGDVLAVGAILLGLAGRTAVDDALRAGADDARGPVPEVTAGPSVAFYASSLDEVWPVSGDYGGRLIRDGAGLRVEIRDATVQYLGFDAEHAQALTGVRLALAEASVGGFRIVRRGPLVPVDAPFQPGVRQAAGSLTLTLSDVSEEDMVGRWLVVVHEQDARGLDTPLESYAHADRAILARLMGWIEDGC